MYMLKKTVTTDGLLVPAAGGYIIPSSRLIVSHQQWDLVIAGFFVMMTASQKKGVAFLNDWNK